MIDAVATRLRPEPGSDQAVTDGQRFRTDERAGLTRQQKPERGETGP